MELTCPSGLRGVVRKLKTSEANTLADENLQRKNEALDSVLRACWQETLDPGPYIIEEGKKPNWDKILVADRFVTTLGLRVATYGPDYAFEVQCRMSDCRKKFGWNINLGTDLKIREFPTESLRAFRDGNKFEGRIESLNKDFIFHLQDGAAEKTSSELLKKNRKKKLSIALFSRIDEVEGVARGDLQRFFENLDMDVTNDLLEKLDEVDGGVDTDIEVECEACGNIQEVALPLGKEFWLPSRRKTQLDSESSPERLLKNPFGNTSSI